MSINTPTRPRLVALWLLTQPGYYKALTTNTLDSMAVRPRGKRLSSIISKFVPHDWFNYFF